MFTLLLPQRGVLIVDTHFGETASRAEEYNIIAEKEGLKLIRYDGFQDGVWYPLNALVLPGEEEEDVVVVDDKAISLIKLLKDEGAKPIGVTMPQQDHPDGKINCQTNTFNLDDNLTLNDLVEPLPRIKFKLGGKIFWI